MKRLLKSIIALLTGISIFLFYAPIPYIFATGSPTFDAFNHNLANTNSLTISHTVAGSGECDVLFLLALTGTDSITGVTDNGTNMTLLNKADWHTNTQGDRHWQVYTYALTPAPTGTTNVVVSLSTTVTINGAVFSYSGCGGTDTHVLNAPGTTSAASFSGTIATSIANETIWAVGQTDNSAVTGTWGQTTRWSDGVLLNGNYGDASFASAGTQTVSWTDSPAQDWMYAAVALCPTGGCGGATFNFWQFLDF